MSNSKPEKTSKLKNQIDYLIWRLTGSNIAKWVIQAGFPYYKNPHLYQWLWVFILMPFLPEETLNELAAKHGKQLRELYRILVRYPKQFSRLLELLSIPLFFELLGEFEQSDNHPRIRLIIDDTKSEKFGKCMEFIHKLFDNGKNRYVMGYNYLFVVVACGEMVFPLMVVLWLPKEGNPEYQSKNDIAKELINKLNEFATKRGKKLDEVEITFDSAYFVNKVIEAVEEAGLRLVSKPSNNYKFIVGVEELTIPEIIERVKDGRWQILDGGVHYQRIEVQHPLFGKAILMVRKRKQKNGQWTYDALICNKLFYPAHRIDACYRGRWEIEMIFKYYKQHLKLGKSQFRKLGAIKSQLCCVGIAGLLVALYRRLLKRKLSFRQAVKRMTAELFKICNPFKSTTCVLS